MEVQAFATERIRERLIARNIQLICGQSCQISMRPAVSAELDSLSRPIADLLGGHKPVCAGTLLLIPCVRSSHPFCHDENPRAETIA